MPKITYLKDYQLPNYKINTIKLLFIFESINVKIINLMDIESINEKCTSLLLDGEKQELVNIAINNRILNSNEFLLTNNSLKIFQVPKRFQLKIITICQPHLNTKLVGLYKSDSIYCTQCEPNGFRKITYFIDRPDILSIFTVKIIADRIENPILLSNGNCIDYGYLNNNRHYIKWHDPYPKPSYLFALVVGKLDVKRDFFTTSSGKIVNIELYSSVENINKVDFAISVLKSSMKWDEINYGREYDLNVYMIVAISNFNMGAMENKGLNIFNTQYILADPEISTDQDYQNITSIIGHEYFHNWTGNRVTCRDWFQLTLKEGLTVFREQCFMEDQFSCNTRIEDINTIRSLQFLEDSSPIAHSIQPNSYQEINNFYTITIYNKGAEIVRMLYTLVGKLNFRKSMDTYFLLYDKKAITCDDFINVISKSNNIDLTKFKLWYSQIGTPFVYIKKKYYDKRKKIYTIILVQKYFNNLSKKPLVIPIKFALFGLNGKQIKIQYKEKYNFEHILILNKKEQIFTFNQVIDFPVPSILRGFSAPIKINTKQNIKELIFLIKYDNDKFNKWNSAQIIFKKNIYFIMKNIKNKKKKIKSNTYFFQEMKNIFNSNLDPSFIAEMFTLPKKNIFFEENNSIDIDILEESYDFFSQNIAKYFEDFFLKKYQSIIDIDNTITPTNIGKRKLKNICLYYLCLLKSKYITDLAIQQYKKNNMTNKIFALSIIINNANSSLRKKIVSHFYLKYKYNPLLMNKWLYLQATGRYQNVFKDIQKLLKNPIYNDRNPNNINSLLKGFTKNLKEFHNPNGQGYIFISDNIIHIDKYNPQISADLVQSLIHWKNFDIRRKYLMKKELFRIYRTQNISSNLKEIIDKSNI